MKKFIFLTSILTITQAFASEQTNRALKYVPGGTVVQEKIKEVKIRTPKGSIVEVEFTGTGAFEEASGDDIRNDYFRPDDNNIPLPAILAKVIESGKNPTGDWSYENSFLTGWHYELEGYENGVKMDYVVNAKTGEIVTQSVDD